jgi:hypothetical protein
MSVPLIAALCFTSILLVTTAYFLMGSVPLLILEHDTPMDARFVRRFFEVYYTAALFAAGATALSYVLAGRLAFAALAAALATLATSLRRTILPRMEAVGAQIEAGGAGAIRAFRQLHGVAIAINLAQLVVVVWSLIVNVR